MLTRAEVMIARAVVQLTIACSTISEREAIEPRGISRAWIGAEKLGGVAGLLSG